LLQVFGNSLVVISVIREKTLRTATNYFIVSLATSDVMVALLVMPLSIYGEVFICRCAASVYRPLSALKPHEVTDILKCEA